MAVDFESFGFTRHFFPGNPQIFLRVTRAETRASRSSKWVKDNRELLAKISRVSYSIVVANTNFEASGLDFLFTISKPQKRFEIVSLLLLSKLANFYGVIKCSVYFFCQNCSISRSFL